MKIWLRWGIFNDTVKGSNISLFQYPKDIDIHYPPGVSSVAHAASILNFFTNSRGFVVNGTPILRSAAAQPTVTWFVVSSPSIAIDYTRPNTVYSISEALGTKLVSALRKPLGNSDKAKNVDRHSENFQSPVRALYHEPMGQ